MYARAILFNSTLITKKNDSPNVAPSTSVTLDDFPSAGASRAAESMTVGSMTPVTSMMTNNAVQQVRWLLHIRLLF